MKRCIFLLFVCLVLALPAAGAWAEDVFTISVDVLDLDSLNSDDYVARFLSANAQGVRVTKYLSDSSELAAPVRLTLTQMESGTLLFDKDYGYQTGTFDSGAIYLPYVGDRTIPYLVTLYVGQDVYALPFMQLQPRLRSNSACTLGPRMYEYSSVIGRDWLMGTMLDLDSLRQTGRTVIDVVATNRYLIGQATVEMQNDALMVSLAFDASANVEVESWQLYIATDCTALARGAWPASRQLGEWVETGGASSALLYLPMLISYDPSGLPSASLSDAQTQLALWNENCQSGGELPDGSGDDMDACWGGDEGWTTSGWVDNAGWVDNNGWIDNNESTDGGWSDGGGWMDYGGSEENGWSDDGQSIGENSEDVVEWNAQTGSWETDDEWN